jgi:hypothetical protein
MSSEKKNSFARQDKKRQDKFITLLDDQEINKKM